MTGAVDTEAARPPGAGGATGSLLDLLARSAARFPEAPAIDGDTVTVTYRQLWRRAAALAAAMRERGVQRGDRVLVSCVDPVDAITSMQAALMLGAVYVPVSEDSPLARIRALAGDCGAALLCTSGDPAVVTAIPVPVLDVGAAVVAERQLDRPAEVDPDAPAYILYTSGSTGRPKGVTLSHRNARAFVDWAVATFQVRPVDRLANHASFTFDLSVFDIYAAFAAGACVVPVPRSGRLDPRRLTAFLHQRRITIWYSVPSALVLMMRYGGLTEQPPPACLRLILFAGEPFPIRPLRALSAWARCEMYNLYGPTETNVCTYHRLVPADLLADGPVPIGRAASGDRLMVDRGAGHDGGDRRGELLVAGPSVFLGYWGRPEHAGWYRTGDLVCERPDGSLAYLGRVDDMIKHRGHRIEPAELEAVANAYPGVGGTVVVTAGAGIDAALVLVVETDPGSSVGGIALRRHIRTQLPPFMLPDEILPVERIPVGSRGKVDRGAVRRLVEQRLRRDAQ